MGDQLCYVTCIVKWQIEMLQHNGDKLQLNNLEAT